MRCILPFILFAAVVTQSSAQEKDGQRGSFSAAVELKEFERLHRLSAALQHMQFPDAENRIRTWKQHHTEGFAGEADPGIGITIDADEWTLGRIKNLWADGWNDHDLTDVVVITKEGRKVEFLDMTDANFEQVKDTVIGRGDAVIFLKKAITN